MMLNEKATISIIWTVLYAIDSIHVTGLYHGGIRDSQILFTRDGQIK